VDRVAPPFQVLPPTTRIGAPPRAGLLGGDHASPGASARASGLEQFLEGASGRVLLGHVR
jgi:hypothetical protein